MDNTPHANNFISDIPARPPLVILTGPTAVGKTALSVNLAKKIGGEIVSADSIQVYRRMDIGTAKPTPEEMRDFYARVYPQFDKGRFQQLMQSFELDMGRKVNTFSKGMKKQLSVICGVCAGTDYLFCDETFDGLDPVAQQAVKSLFADGIAQRGLTPVVASHNLRELEDICDHVGLLHRGGILFSRDLDDMKLGINKVQCVFDDPMRREDFAPLEVLQFEQRGSLYTVTARANREDLTARIQEMRPIFFEVLPLTLEEIFISETEVCGYDIKKLLF